MGRLRRCGRAPVPTATWFLHTLDDRAGHGASATHELRRDGVTVASVDLRPDRPETAGPVFSGHDHELSLAAGPRRTVLIQHRDGQVIGRIALVRRYWSGYLRAEIGERVLIAPIGRLRSAWNAVDDAGVVRRITFGASRDAIVRADLPADLDPAALAAVLYFFRYDRRVAVADNCWRG